MSSRLLGLATSAMLLGSTLATVGCEGQQGAGLNGKDGVNGKDGIDGQSGAPGVPGTPGVPGAPGSQGPAAPVIPGVGNVLRAEGVAPGTPVSSMVAVTFRGDAQTGAETLADHVKARVAQVAAGTLPAGVEFPVAAGASDSVRTAQGIYSTVVTKWMDPLSYLDFYNSGFDPMKVPRFGANADYIAFFGEGWDASGNLSPVYTGSGTAGWVWVNHEYVSNNRPGTSNAPKGQHMVLARWLRSQGLLNNDVTQSLWGDTDLRTYVHHWKKQVGGSYFRVVQDTKTGTWTVDLAAPAKRFDATSGTLTKVVGQALSAVDHDDSGNPLPEGVVSGIHSDCSGGQTPWGTLITAEENVQSAYGDLETAWDGNNNLLFTTLGEDPNTYLAGANVTPVVAPRVSPDVVNGIGEFSPGTGTDAASNNARHNRDMHGYLVEIDPKAAPGEYYGKTTAGAGHRKLGGMGRARWENATFAVGPDFKLVDGKHIVIYGGDDRRSGRIYKFVSSAPYTAGMTRNELRQLLDTGRLYVAHFANLNNKTGMDILDGTGAVVVPTPTTPGQGRWIELSVNNDTDLAPNAGKTVKRADGTTDYSYPSLKVGQALRDVSYNGLGGFPNDDEVRRALFTASNKIGVMELNRPEDLEWNPKDPSGTPTLYIAFTEHGRTTALRQNGTLITAALDADGNWVKRNRDDANAEEKTGRNAERSGGIFGLREADPMSPGTSTTFTFFRVWKGKRKADAGYDAMYDASKPDNIAIDRDGGVWFGTDGNPGNNSTSDAIYYLDLNPAHVGKTYGKAFRVVATPGDSEATGPAFTPDMRTLFFNVQHPGEDAFSSWP